MKTPLPRKDLRKLKCLVRKSQLNSAPRKSRPTRLGEAGVHHEDGREEQEELAASQVVQGLQDEPRDAETDQQ